VLSASVRATARSRIKTVREYYDRHPIPLLLTLFITIGSPVLGLFLAGATGVLVGIAIGLVTFLLGARAIITVREIEDKGEH
jgi:hypothetical protein